jgi:PAS domain S-box-containing protein
MQPQAVAFPDIRKMAMDDPKDARNRSREENGSSGFETGEPDRHFRTIFEHIADGVVLADMDSKQFYLANSAFCRMLGYSVDEIRQLSVADIHPAEHLPFVLGEFEKQATQEQSLSRDIPVKRKDGSIFYADINAFPITLSRRTYLMGLFRDISDWKQAQQELDAYRQRMCRAERLASAGTLSATVAHELMQPLTVVKLSLDDALTQIDASTYPRTVIEALEQCQNGTQDAISIVKRFRCYARHSTLPVSGPVDVGAVAARTASLLRERARARRVSLVVEGMDDLPMINTSEKGIEQVCFALIDNAIQAADGKNDHTVVIKGQVAEEQVVLWFEDDCCGMPPEILDKIFQPFFTTKPPSEGTGLGLCIVERMVSNAGGKIYVESRLHRGSTFCVTLPVH